MSGTYSHTDTDDISGFIVDGVFRLSMFEVARRLNDMQAIIDRLDAQIQTAEAIGKGDKVLKWIRMGKLCL